MKKQIYNAFKFLANCHGTSVVEYINEKLTKLTPVNLEKDCEVISFDNGKTFYKLLDVECIYIDERHQIYLDSGGEI